MLEKLSTILRRWSNEGIRFPFAHDPETAKPSVTLLFSYITFVLGFVSVASLLFTDSTLMASIVSILFWTMALVFYRIRKLDKFKIDLDDRSVELNSADEESSQGDKK